MQIIPFGIAILRKTGDYYWLPFDPTIPERLGWKIRRWFSITLNENGDLLAQPHTKRKLDNLIANPESGTWATLLESPYPYQPKCYFHIPKYLIQKVRPWRSQPFALIGINQNQLLIIKLA